MKRIFTLLLALSLAGCSKNDTSPLENQQINLIGLSANATNSIKWKLSALSIAGVSQRLTSSQSSYQKQYSSDGTFSDSDGLTGTWSIPVTDSLVENYTNFSSNVSVRQGYLINALSNSQMILTYNVNGNAITTTYTGIH